MSNSCAQCAKERAGDVWLEGEVCVCGIIYCCSLECARLWAAQNVKPEIIREQPDFVFHVHSDI